MDTRLIENRKKSRLPGNVGILIGIIAIFAPFGIIVNPPLYTISSVTWIVLFKEGNWDYNINPLWWIISIPFTFFRFIFIRDIIRFYKGEIKKSRLIKVGILADLSIVIYCGLTSMPNLVTGFFPDILLGIPFPLLLFVAWLLLKFFPPPIDQEWIKRERDEGWWPKIHVKEQDIESTDEAHFNGT